MTNEMQTARELLDRILSAGQDVVKDVRENTGDLTEKSKDIASRGEDILVDKLGVEDTEAGREALRKGLGAGAAAGALALLLSSRSGRKVATLGGLAGLGVLAYKSYQKNGGTMPNWKEELDQLLSGPKAGAHTEALLRAMVAAAKADGKIDAEEMAMLNTHASDAVPVLEAALSQEPDPEAIAALAQGEQSAREIYAISARVADGVNLIERDYLDRLAMALELNPELAARIETDIRTG